MLKLNIEQFKDRSENLPRLACIIIMSAAANVSKYSPSMIFLRTAYAICIVDTSVV